MTFKIHFLAFSTQILMLLLFSPDTYTLSYKGATSHTTNNAANKSFNFQQPNVIIINRWEFYFFPKPPVKPPQTQETKHLKDVKRIHAKYWNLSGQSISDVFYL